jgi:predicted nucleic acid-binding protein
MRPVLFDTSVYIAALQKGERAVAALRRWTRGSPVWLSAVVLEELHAGAGAPARRALEQLGREFAMARRILVPSSADWAETGKLLARFAEGFDEQEIGQARLVNDALIGVSAVRRGITVFTTDKRDFARLARFRPILWQVAKLKR